MKHKLTVTVGIPVYNEEENIKNLLLSIVNQKINQKKFKLEKILVVCDGSTDDTPNIVKCLSNKDKRIVVINRLQNRGKVYSLHEIYNFANSDLLLTIDGDVIFSTNKDLENLIKSSVENPNAVLIGAKFKPIGFTKKFTSKIIELNYKLWDTIREEENNGNSIYNFWGPVALLTKKFYKSIKFPNEVIHDPGYIYLESKKFGTFYYCRSVTILYTPITRIKDFIKFYLRTDEEKQKLSKLDSQITLSEYSISFRKKVYVILQSFAINPIETIALISLHLYLNVSKFNKVYVHNLNTWERLSESKKELKI